MANSIKLSEWIEKDSKKVNRVKDGIVITHGGRNNKFTVDKMSYKRRLDDVSNHMNYFLEFYDTDAEILNILLSIKSFIHTTPRLTREDFIKQLYPSVFTSSIKDKILALVNDNYQPPLLGENTSDIRFLGIKKVMIVATAIKLLVPAVFEYISVHSKDKDKFELYEMYKPAFYIFEETEELHDVLSKLVDTIIAASFLNNKLIYESKNLTIDSVTENIFKNTLVGSTFYKCKFDKDCFRLIYVVIDQQSKYDLLSI